MTRPQKGEGFPGQQIVVLPKWAIANALQQPLLRDLLPTDIGFFPKAAGHLRERTVGVDQAIFIYCTQGLGWCELAGQNFSVKPGELLIIPPGISHAYGADEKKPWSIFWVHAAGANMKLLLEELGVSIERPLLFLGQDPQLVALFEEAIEILEHGYTAPHLLYASRTLAHLTGLMIWHRHQKWQGDPEPRQKMAQSIAFMKSHLNRPLKVSHLAAMVNLSSSHYSALFKRQTGYAPIDYFIRLRLHQACQLLDNTDLSVKEVAAALGYEDPFYFSRIFKALNDISPTEYRMLHKG
jgi:AraC family transcriptional regulator, arabinose operon regulatory protein